LKIKSRKKIDLTKNSGACLNFFEQENSQITGTCLTKKFKTRPNLTSVWMQKVAR
jgi:hypothetical protein